VVLSTATRPFAYAVEASDEASAVVLAVESHVSARRPAITHTDVRHMGIVDNDEPPAPRS
jgi:hypothetical protein